MHKVKDLRLGVELHFNLDITRGFINSNNYGAEMFDVDTFC